jgi:hypothetical protein
LLIRREEYVGGNPFQENIDVPLRIAVFEKEITAPLVLASDQPGDFIPKSRPPIEVRVDENSVETCLIQQGRNQLSILRQAVGIADPDNIDGWAGGHASFSQKPIVNDKHDYMKARPHRRILLSIFLAFAFQADEMKEA